MRRRDFITGIAGSLVAWPLAGLAQHSATPVIGYLGLETPDLYASRLHAFREGLSTTGYEEGRNVAIEYRWRRVTKNDCRPSQPTLFGGRLTWSLHREACQVLSAKAATSTIPIVFEMGADPSPLGLVQSLNHPGGNITGATSLSGEVNPKRLELMHELIPAASLFGFLVNPTNPANAQASIKLMKEAADALGLELKVLNASKEDDFDVAFATLVNLHAGGMIIANDTFYVTRQEQLAMASLRHAMPAISQSREFAAAGGLMCYSGSYSETHKQAGIYTGRILKGEKPSDLPVSDPQR
jgi:putative tryptophan/tyrosine transport system substrate-binding protein